jgi:hypothetical protein
MINKGIVKNFRQAFDLYLAHPEINALPKEIFSAEETIEIIHQANGKAFMAHPVTLRLEEEDLRSYLIQLKEKGLDGIEVYTSAQKSNTKLCV